MTETGNFFAIDRRTWARACGIGLNGAVAYLIVSRGTLRDMRTTAWSAKSVEERTGIPWRKAKEAVQALVTAGLLRQDRGGQHPRYYVMPPDQVRGCEGWMPPDPETEWERDLLARLRALPTGKCSRLASNHRDRVWADRLVAAGLARQNGNEFTATAYDVETAARPDWIWLPIELIDGAADEVPPLELVRQTDSLPMLRLLVDFYHAQSLGDYGGVHWRQIVEGFTRYKLADRGAFVVWGFAAKDGPEAYRDAPFLAPHARVTDDGKPDFSVFWSAYNALRDLGLIEVVAHLVTSDSASGTVIHALPLWGTGETGEREMTAAAMKAAVAMLTEAQQKTAIERGVAVMVPVRRHIANVQLVGLVRLRYRARTRATNARFDASAWAETVKCFAEMERTARSEMNPDVDINGTSTGNQRLFN